MATSEMDYVGGGKRMSTVENITLASNTSTTRNVSNMKYLVISMFGSDTQLLVFENGEVTKLIKNDTEYTPTLANSIIWVSYSNGVITFQSNSGISRTFYAVWW